MADKYYGYQDVQIPGYAGAADDYVTRPASDVEYTPTDWNSKTPEQMWEMVRKESDERTEALAETWRRTASLIQATRDNLQRHADALAAKWSSEAGTIFMMKVGAALHSFDEWKKVADDNKTGLEELARKIRSTQSQVETLWISYQAKQNKAARDREEDADNTTLGDLFGLNNPDSAEKIRDDAKQDFINAVKPLAETYIDVYISNVSRAGKYKGPVNAVVVDPASVPRPSPAARPGARPPGFSGGRDGKQPTRPTGTNLPDGSGPPPPDPTRNDGTQPTPPPGGVTLAGGTVAPAPPPTTTVPSATTPTGPAPSTPTTPAVPGGLGARPGTPPAAPGSRGPALAKPNLPGGGSGAPGRGSAPAKPTLPGSRSGPGGRPGSPTSPGSGRGRAPASPRLPGTTGQGGRPGAAGTPRPGAPGRPQQPSLGGNRGAAPGRPGTPSTGRPGSSQLAGRGNQPSSTPAKPGTPVKPGGPVKPGLGGRTGPTIGTAPATGPKPALGGRNGGGISGPRGAERRDEHDEAGEWAYGEDDELFAVESDTVSSVERPEEHRAQEQGRILGRD